MEIEFTNTAEMKNYLHKLIVETDDFQILKEVKNYFISVNKTADWLDTISEDEKRSIELGLKQLDAGERVECGQVKQKIDKLLGRL